VVHAGDAGAVQRRHHARPADLLLPERGLDSLDGIVGLWNENVWLARQGRRHRQLLGQPALDRREGRPERQDLGRHPLHPRDGQPDAGDQPGLAAARLGRLLPAGLHPEIEEFLEMRRPTGGDPNRKALNLHHGILIIDAFMRAVEKDEEWALLSPKDGR
jgi:ribonucleoside-diphosphate reductase alpha chain